MADLDTLLATVRAGDSPAARAAIRALGEIDDDRARHALAEALAGDGPVMALAIQALAHHGDAAAPLVVAAVGESRRRFGGVAVMGKLGNPAFVPLLRPLVGDPDPMLRVSVAVALYRCGDRDAEMWSAWIRRENDLVVFAFLAAIAGGGLELTHGTLDHFEEQARQVDTPAGVRASAAWAVAQHDAIRGTVLARQLICDAETATALASIVRRRGGPLTALIAGVEGSAAADQVADSVGLPRSAAT